VQSSQQWHLFSSGSGNFLHWQWELHNWQWECLTKMMRLVVEIECVGKIADAFDKASGSSDVLKPEQIPYQFDIGHKFAPFKRKSVQKLCVHLKLFQFHVVDVYIIEE
nr:hypothetical protein [Tanacetum cinerariifolium]